MSTESVAAPAVPRAQPAHFKFWPRRVPHRITTPATSAWHNLAVSALRYPDKAATVFFGRITTYAELARQAERVAAWLRAQGVVKGDRVILLMQNCPQLLAAHFGILRADAVVVPVNPMNRAEELRHYITDPEARVAIVAADLAAGLAEANNTLPPDQQLSHMAVTHLSDGFDLDVTGDDAPPVAWRDWLAKRHAPPTLAHGEVQSWVAVLANGFAVPPHEAGPGDIAVLPYTSGTTGLPKGCIHVHAAIMHQVVAASLFGCGNADNVVLGVVPMFHATGMIGALHGTVYNGATLVIMPRWDRDLAGRLISRWRVTNFTNIPTMVIDLLASPHFERYDLSSLVQIGGGGAAMPQAVAQRLYESYGLRYAEGYGLTETAAPSHLNPYDAPKQQCLGVPYMGTDSRIVDPDTLQEVPQGETGEIITCGPQVFQGYWKQPEATAAAFVEIDGKRFFRTGDLGRMDEDGYFFIMDRLKRMINASGYKVWPAEVENLMFRHPAIQEACVISAPDAYRGETVKAVVVLRPAMRGQVSEQDIVAWCHDNMAVYKAPRIVEFIESLPKSGSGKVMWRALQEAQARLAAAG